MILLLLLSFLLVYNSVGLGYFFKAIISKLYNVDVPMNFLGLLLSGLLLSAVYFNLLSFFIPVNFFSLIPVFVVSSIMFYRENRWRLLLTNLQENIGFFFQQKHILYTLAMVMVLYVYWLVPPVNIDSAGYHYLSILWYEKYKVVPGLANVHGRYAFNPVSFIISAAYSFTSIFKQSIYPLNGVLGCIFLLWLLKKLLQSAHSLHTVVLLTMMIYFQRPLFANMPSPSSEPLMIVCLGYAMFSLVDIMHTKRLTLANGLLPCILILFSITAKLSAVPALLFIPVVFFLLPVADRRWGVVFKTALVAGILWLPWLGRNVILSGYPLYPLPFLNVFTPDWKAPYDVLLLDYTYVKYFPNFFPYELQKLKALSFFQWLGIWISEHFNYNRQLDLAILFSALLSPFYWLLPGMKPVTTAHKQMFWLWLVAYINVWVWLANSPEYRFGVVYHAFAFGLPLLSYSYTGRSVSMLKYAIPVMLWALSVYYTVHILRKETTYSFAFKDYWLYPLKDKRYLKHNDPNTFSYSQLNNGVKLYYEDSTHECISAPGLPCMPWKYGTIEMRGPKMEDGFRNVTNEVRKYYPLLSRTSRNQTGNVVTFAPFQGVAPDFRIGVNLANVFGYKQYVFH